MREELKKTQPIAYKILENALTSHNFAHAYLFFGDKEFQLFGLVCKSELCFS